MKQPKLTIERVEKELKWPSQKWAGQCYGIACQIVEHGLVRGTAVYGHYLGEVHPKSMFAAKAGLFVQHGWINLAGGGILDPTRWVFEYVKPYLYWSPTVGEEYDEGGNRWRSANLRPPPEWDSSDRQVQLGESDLPLATWNWIEKALKADYKKQWPPSTLSVPQLFWLANLPLEALGPHAKPIFEAFDKHGQRAAVPMDNFRRVMEGRWP